MRFLRPIEIQAKALGFRKAEFLNIADHQGRAMAAVRAGQIDQCKRLKVECPTCKSIISFGKVMKSNQCTSCGNPVGDSESEGMRVIRFLERCAASDIREALRLFDEIPFAKPRVKS